MPWALLPELGWILPESHQLRVRVGAGSGGGTSPIYLSQGKLGYESGGLDTSM